ncbi:MAG: hypothetical protein ACXW14_04090, partial [Burkholderiaceae bacterium]
NPYRSCLYRLPVHARTLARHTRFETGKMGGVCAIPGDQDRGAQLIGDEPGINRYRFMWPEHVQHGSGHGGHTFMHEHFVPSPVSTV